MTVIVSFITVPDERDEENPAVDIVDRSNPKYTTVHQDVPLGDPIFRQYQAAEVDNFTPYYDHELFPWRYNTMMSLAKDVYAPLKTGMSFEGHGKEMTVWDFIENGFAGVDNPEDTQDAYDRVNAMLKETERRKIMDIAMSFVPPYRYRPLDGEDVFYMGDDTLITIERDGGKYVHRWAYKVGGEWVRKEPEDVDFKYLQFEPYSMKMFPMEKPEPVKTLTVGEVRELLGQYPDDTPLYVCDWNPSDHHVITGLSPFDDNEGP